MKSDNRQFNIRHVINFRELGGYPTQDGRVIRDGLLYRSGNLGNLTRRDVERLAAINLYAVIDMRSESERKRVSYTFPLEGRAQEIHLPILELSNARLEKEMMDAMRSGSSVNFDPDERMRILYHDMALHTADSYQKFFHILLNAQGRPVLWHCASGKDRTGLTAALVMRLLGVHQESIMREYLLSQRSLRRGKVYWALRLFKGNGLAEAYDVIMSVREHWLRGAFAAIDEHWGSFENYVTDGLKLSSAQVEQLKSQYLY